MDLFFAVVDSPAIEKLDHGIRKHLGMDTEIVLRLQRHTCCIRNSSDPELYAASVPDLLSDEIAYCNADIVQFDRRKHGKLDIVFYDRIDL